MRKSSIAPILWSEDTFKLLKIIEDPKNFCVLHLSIFTIMENKIKKLKILIHFKITNPLYINIVSQTKQK